MFNGEQGKQRRPQPHAEGSLQSVGNKEGAVRMPRQCLQITVDNGAGGGRLSLANPDQACSFSNRQGWGDRAPGRTAMSADLPDAYVY